MTTPNTKQRTNYYICHTPYHLYQCSLIAKQHFSTDLNIAIIEGNANTKDYSSFNKEIRLDYIGGSVFKTYSIIEDALKVIKQEISNHETNRIFLSDIAWPLCNRIFFEKKLSNCEFNLFSDGVAAYLNKKRTAQNIIRDISKNLLSKIRVTSKYCAFKGHALGYDHPKAKGFFLPNPNSINYSANNKHEVMLPSCATQPEKTKSKNLLFLDQPFWLIIKDNWPEIIKSTIEHIKAHYPEHNLFFKKHHRSREEENIAFMTHDFVELESDVCIEELVSERDYSVIISFYSSALLHLRWILSAETVIINLTNEELIKQLSINSEITELYKTNSITTITLNQRQS